MTEIMWTCCGDEVFDPQGIMAHLESVHGITRPIQGERKGVMHLDGEGWIMATYEWKIGDLVLHQSVKFREGEEATDAIT